MLYFYAGWAALHVADDAAAVKWFIKARQANPKYPETALWLAAAYLELGKSKRTSESGRISQRKARVHD
jgi:hypothetical protein